MRKLAFLQKESLSRLGVAFLLTAGILTPLLMALDLSAYLMGALMTAALLLVGLTALTVSRKSRKLLWISLGLVAAVQFFLPGTGLLGDGIEGLKALAL